MGSKRRGSVGGWPHDGCQARAGFDARGLVDHRARPFRGPLPGVLIWATVWLAALGCSPLMPFRPDGGASGGTAGATAGGSSGGTSGGTAGGASGGTAGGASGGAAGGASGGTSGGAAGGSSGGAAGGAGGGSCGCPAPSNATPLCADAGCDFVCSSGFHRCSDRCAPDDSVIECGPLCSPCSDQGGLAVCRAGVCDFTCTTAQARCAGQCVTASDTQCGPLCQACAIGSRCIAGACQATCAPGQIVINGVCAEGRELAMGNFHACARHDGGVVCWGGLVSTGALGSGPSDGGRTPRFAQLQGEVRALGLTDNGSCALLTTGAVRCWGDNTLGQVGNGATMNAFTPGITVASNAVSLASGANHSCALLDDGGVLCWGTGTSGQVGNGVATLAVRAPLPASLSAPAVAIFAGNDVTWSTRVDGGVIAWGQDSLLPFSLTPVPVLLDGGVRAIASGDSHSCAIRADRTLACWGRGAEGQLGYPVSVTNAQPVRPVAGLGPVNDVCVGTNFTCVIIADGGVRCFGLGTSGQLGGANFTSSSAPVTTDLPEAARQVACHYQSTCATTALGVACWGDNGAGQLGSASPVQSATPVYVPMP
jgi:hypothetical protein